MRLKRRASHQDEIRQGQLKPINYSGAKVTWAECGGNAKKKKTLVFGEESADRRQSDGLHVDSPRMNVNFEERNIHFIHLRSRREEVQGPQVASWSQKV